MTFSDNKNVFILKKGIEKSEQCDKIKLISLKEETNDGIFYF